MEEVIFGRATGRAEGIMVGYTTWGPSRGGCGHAHETLEGGLRCLEEDRQAVNVLGEGQMSDRRLQRLLVYPPDSLARRPLIKEDHEALNAFESLW